MTAPYVWPGWPGLSEELPSKDFDLFPEDEKTVIIPKYECQCGKDKHGFMAHSNWCDMHPDKVAAREASGNKEEIWDDFEEIL